MIIVGKLTTSVGSAVQWATITFDPPSGNSIKMVTDGEGNYNANIPAGTYRVIRLDKHSIDPILLAEEVVVGSSGTSSLDALLDQGIPSYTAATLPDPATLTPGAVITNGGTVMMSAGGDLNPIATQKSSSRISGTMTVQRDCTLHIADGSPLDFSGISNTAVPAGSNGTVIINSSDVSKLAEAGSPTVEKRFSIATYVADPSYIPIPSDKTKITAGVMHLRKCGYNAIRVHGIENWLMAGQYGSVSFNQERLDLYYFFLAECKRAGIYWILNPQSPNLYVDMNGSTNRFAYTNATNCKSRIYVEQDIRNNWKSGFNALYNTVNPYTGVNIIQDPALMQIELYNESGFVLVAGKEFPAQWKTRTAGSVAVAKTWLEWLSDPAQAHGYTNIAVLNSSWGTAHASFEAAASVALPPINTAMASTAQNMDMVTYALYLEDDLASFYQSCLSEWGYSGLSCMHNLFPNNVVSRNVGKLSVNNVCNSHGYAMLADALTAGLSLSLDNLPVWNWTSWLFGTACMGSGKPKLWGEHGWPAWGKYRNQYPMLFSLAAMQGSAAVTYFSQGDFFTDEYNNDTTRHGERIRRIEPYHNPSDPITDFIRVLQQVLFIRGDVSEAAYKQDLVLNDRYYGINPKVPARLYRALTYLFQPLYYLASAVKTNLVYTSDTTDDTLSSVWNAKSYLQLLQGMQTQGAVTADNLSLVSATVNNGAISAVATTGTVAGGTATVTQPILTIGTNTLVDGDVIFITNLTGSVGTWPGTNNKNATCVVDVLDATHIQIVSGLNLTGLIGTNFTAGTWCEGANVLQSGTKEWGMSRRLGYCWIDTAKTKYVGNVSASLPVALSNLSVSEMSAGAAVFVTSIDGNALTSSKKMLIGMVGNSKNAGMTFTDVTEKTLATTGDYPILTDDVVCTFRINCAPSGLPVLRKLNRDGTYANYQPERLPVDPTGVYVSVRSDVGNFWELSIE